MKQTVQILGMTCQNCVKGVTEKLNFMDGISQVEVSLENAQASFDNSKSIDLAQLEATLGDKYSVHPIDSSMPAGPSKWKQLRPLFLIFIYVFAGSLFLSPGASNSLWMSNFMGLFFIVFSFFKFLDYTSFPASFQQYDPIAKRVPIYGWVYPFMETFLGLSFLFQWQITYALWITLICLSITTIGVIATLRLKKTIQCACLGTVLDLPMTEATIIENTIMIVMAGLMLGGLV